VRLPSERRPGTEIGGGRGLRYCALVTAAPGRICLLLRRRVCGIYKYAIFVYLYGRYKYANAYALF
jgi:hypothetical protein